MSELRFVKMWTCSQCGDPLGKTCKKCVKHPDRKPVIQEWYKFPPISRICECGMGASVPCQRPGCAKTRWIDRKNVKAGCYRYKHAYCSSMCSNTVLAESRKHRVMVPCGWCQKPVERTVSQAKNFAHAFCRMDHYQMWNASKAHKDKEEAKKAMSERALLECRGKCNDITEHETKTDVASCLSCGAKRSHAFKVDAT